MNQCRLRSMFLLGYLVVSPGMALAADSPSAAFQSGKPIEITADTLDVLQDKKQAVFRGNVEAVQGDIHLKADEMQVHYRESGEEGNQIARIDVHGHVFLATLQETARGRSGAYDVDRGLLTLQGDVLLTRAENVIRGEVLRYDLNTGRSQIDAGTAAVPAADEKGAASGTKQRVRGVFYPGKE